MSVSTACRWADRYRSQGPAGMVDRSSRPRRSPNQTPTRTERRIIKVRVLRRWGPARIGYLLGIHPSTVHRVLTRYGLAKLRWLDRPTGRVIRRMESARPGDLVHVDVKKLGKIPAGGGWRMLGRSAGKRNAFADKSSGMTKNRKPVRGYHFLHTALDAHSRLAYSEMLVDERKETAAEFWDRANAWFIEQGIIVRKVLTDNGSCYRSHAFRNALGDEIEHRRTRPYRPQTNGKIERFHRTLADGWAFRRMFLTEDARRRALPGWLHEYNHHRSHTAIGRRPPISRLTNLSGQYN